MMGTAGTKLMFSAVGIAASLAAFLPGVSAQNKPVEQFTAFAINMNRRPTGPNRPATATIDIRIERWSTDAERDALLNIVREESNVNRANQALLRALQQLPRVGTFREATSLAWDLRFARQNPLDEGGRRIVLATDRPIGFWEASTRPRTIDYPFTILQLQLDKANRGEGKMLADTRILIDSKTNDLVLEHFDIQPVRLNQIRPR